jgi:DNA-binding IclR family transcriptional regulator
MSFEVRDRVQGFEKVFKVWQLIQDAREVSFNEIVENTKLTKSFCRRAVNSLLYLGLISKDFLGKYHVRRRISKR